MVLMARRGAVRAAAAAAIMLGRVLGGGTRRFAAPCPDSTRLARARNVQMRVQMARVRCRQTGGQNESRASQG